MSQNSSCIEKEALVDYLYGELDADARRRVDAHLRYCERCGGEVRSLTEVRQTIRTWEPPDADLAFRVVAAEGGPLSPRVVWRPAWALAAAAVLAVAAALIVRPEVEVRSGGMVLHVGWSAGETEGPGESSGPPSESDPRRPAAVGPGPGTTVRGTPAGLRTGGGAIPMPGPAAGGDPDPMTGDEVLLQEIRELIRGDSVARQELLDYLRQISERR